MNKDPLISVIVLCYNQENTISRTLDSILSQQTIYSFEIIIGEDASPNDNTRTVCERYATKYPQIIRLLPWASNKGILKNYSDCLNECRGKYIATCAGDDWWHNPDKLQLQVDFLENNEDYGLVFSAYRIVKFAPITGEEIFSNSNIIPNPEKDTYKQLIEGNFISAGTVLFRNDIFKKYVDFEKFKSLGFYMEDYPMWLELIQHTRFKYIPFATMTYTIVEGSLSNSMSDFQKTEKFENAVLNIKKYYISKYPIKEVDMKELLRIYHRSLTITFIRQAHFERAKYHSRFLIDAGVKDFVRMIICHTPIINIYFRYLNK